MKIFRIIKIIMTLMTFHASAELVIDDFLTEIEPLPAEKTLEKIHSVRDKWPTLSPLHEEEDLEKRNTKRKLAEKTLAAFREEALHLRKEKDKNEIMRKVLRTQSILNALHASGGYTNEVVSVGGQFSMRIGVWNFLYQFPDDINRIEEFYKELAKKGNIEMVKWYRDRAPYDPWLKDKQGRIEKIKDDFDPVKMMTILNFQRKNIFSIKSIPKLIDEVDIVALGNYLLIHEASFLGALPAAIDYQKRGGKWSKEEYYKSRFHISEVTRVYGKEGLPFFHRAYSGRIHIDRVWGNINTVEDDSYFRGAMKGIFGLETVPAGK